MRYRILLLSTIFIFIFNLASADQDSIGIQEKEGEKFIVHQVHQGQNLEYLSDRYNVSQQAIKDANPDVDEVQVYDYLLVPYNADSYSDNDRESEIASSQEPDESQQTEQRDRSEEQKEEAETHTVESGQTLYSIAQKYEVRIEKIQEWNDLDGFNISEGQKLKVTPPTGKKKDEEGSSERHPVDDPDTEQTESGSEPDEKKTHIVESGQTLYSISRKYEVNIDKLQEWNDLEDYNLSEGQSLIVGIPPAEDAREEPMPAEDPEKQHEEKAEEYEEGSKENEERDGYRKITEEGKGGWMESYNGGSQSSLAVHNSAPVGTIIQVKNLMNDKVAYVRVVGSIPGSSEGDELVIKISEAAAKKLDVRDPHFRTEIEYSLKDNS